MYEVRASGGSLRRWAFASAVERLIASSRSRGSATLVPSSATIIPIAVPVEVSPSSRRLTGIPALSGRSGTRPCSIR